MVTADARMVQTQHKPESQIEATPTPGEEARAETASTNGRAAARGAEGLGEPVAEMGQAKTGTAIEVRAVSKCYQIYRKPADRLKQALWRHRRRFFREFWAVRDLDFTVEHGECIGIIGRNGSGKSTLVQMIAGTLTPTCGTIRVGGRVSALLELGAGFNHEFTGRENVYMAGSIRGLSRKEISARFEDIAAFADIGDFLDQPVKTYSSGMYVRLAFAVIAQLRPEILVVDEALAVGDVFFRQRCHKFMREDLAGVTKLLVTHDLNTVANHCDRVLVLHKGRLVFVGSPLDAIAHYTKIIHTEKFAGAPDSSKAGAKGGRGSVQAEFRGANSAPPAAGAEDIPWCEVGEDKLGGAGEVTIRRVAITDPDGEPIKAIQPTDAIRCHCEIEVAGPKSGLIFGTMINDRFGNAVCGDNSLSLRHGSVDCPSPGRYHVRMDFAWPELKPGEYTVTFGVGEGNHAHHHTVQCWAHNVLALTAIAPRRPVHGMFTNPMKDVRIDPVG